MFASKGWLTGVAFLCMLPFVGACGSDKKSENTPPPQGQDSNGTDNEEPGDPPGQPREDGSLFEETDMNRSQNGGFSAAIVWEDGPKVGYCQIKLVLADNQRQAPTSQELVKFEPFMTVHGHGGSLKKMTIAPVEGEPSSYRIAMFYLTMSGPWDLNITARVNDQEDTAVIPIQVP